MRSLLSSLLKELAGVMDDLGRINLSPKLNPQLLAWSLTALTILAAFSHTLQGPLLALIFTLTLAALLGVEAKPLASILALSLLLGAAPSIPLLFSSTGLVNGLGDLDVHVHMKGLVVASSLTLRVVAAASPMAVAALYLGWPLLVRSLVPLERDVKPGSLRLVPMLIPRLARHVSSLLAAREARLIKPRIWEEWRILASAAGDMLAGVNSYSSTLMLAVEARSIASVKTHCRNPSLLDALYLAAWLVILVGWVVAEHCY